MAAINGAKSIGYATNSLDGFNRPQTGEGTVTASTFFGREDDKNRIGELLGAGNVNQPQ